MAKTSPNASSWQRRPQRDELADAQSLKSAYLEHAFWQWLDGLPESAQDHFHQIGTLLSGITVALTATPHTRDGQPEGTSSPFEDEAGLRYAELTPQSDHPYPFLRRGELELCLETALELVRRFLEETLDGHEHSSQNELMRPLAYLHFATYGALARGKSIRKPFLTSVMEAIRERSEESPGQAGDIVLFRIREQLEDLIETTGRGSFAELSAAIRRLHEETARHPGVLTYLVTHELRLAERLPEALSSLRTRLASLLKDASFVPDNPKVELFLRRTAVNGFCRDFTQTRQPFSRYHLQVVRPPYRAVRQVIDRIQDRAVRQLASDFVSRITRLMEYLRLVRAQQERRDRSDELSALPIQKLSLAVAIEEARSITEDFTLPEPEEDVDLDFEAGFGPAPDDRPVPVRLFDPAASTARLDAQEVSAALEDHQLEKTGLDADRLHDLFAIFTWRLGELVEQLEGALRSIHAGERGDRGGGVETAASTTRPDRDLVRRSGLEKVIQRFRECVLNQSRQVLWEMCHEIQDTLTFEEVIPEFKAGKDEALALRSRLEKLLEKTRHYHALVDRSEEEAPEDPKGEAERCRSLKHAFVQEARPFVHASLLRPDDREILAGKMAQLRVAENPREIRNQIDDFMHFLESLLSAINRRWVLLISDKERLEECRTEIESILLGSREPDEQSLLSVASRLESLGSRSPALARAGASVRRDLVFLLQSPPAGEDRGRDGARLVSEMVELRLETAHAAVTEVLDTSF
jgi:hypothetical protein